MKEMRAAKDISFPWSYRNIRVLLLFVSVSLGNCCFAVTDFAKCIFLLKTLSQTKEINIGERVTIQTPSKEIEAKFIGISKETNTSPSLYFLEEETGRIIELPENMMELNGIKIRTDSFFLKIEKQEENNCAVHSTVNCLRQMDNIGALTNVAISNTVRTNLPLLFKQLSILESENVRRLLIRNGRSTHNVGYDQAILRQRVFRENGIESELFFGDLKGAQEKTFLANIKLGRPVILDLDVKISATAVLKPKDAVLSEDSRQWLVPTLPTDPQSIGGHSVLAVGYIQTQKGGWLRSEQGKVLILDSYTGSFALWDLADIRKACRYALVLKIENRK